jgi:hypothetical protein
MEKRVEGGPREPLVAAASPICPKCKAYFRFTETFLDVRRNLTVRRFRCECGQLICGTKDQHRRTNGVLFIPMKIWRGNPEMKPIGLQPCILCCLDREFAGAEAVTRHYEIQRLVCPGCDSVIRLVQKRGTNASTVRHLRSGSFITAYKTGRFNAR